MTLSTRPTPSDAATEAVDPVALAARLLRCPSVTPEEGGALVLLEQVLTGAGFRCTRVDRNGVPNLFARWGEKAATRSFGFNGHTDVVPPGNPADWTHPPFGGEIVEGVLWGRGATDMKTGVAAFAAAACDFVRTTPPEGAVVLTLTGDEEGPGRDGTLALLDWMAAEGERMSVCLVGEPTCPEVLGDMIKIGRRGSMTVRLTASGKQGHVAYPHLAVNPLHALVALLNGLTAAPLDDGTEHFDPSTLQLTSIDCGNPATNVVPARATAAFNIRFNDAHSPASLTAEIQRRIAETETRTGARIEAEFSVSGDSFLTPPGPFVDLVSRVVTAETGVTPVLSTSGGTSDARFVKNHCPVLEFGLVGKTMHAVDERIETEQIVDLKRIYGRILAEYFA